MKKILSLIFIGVAIAFTGCTEEPNTAEPNSANETALTKATEENMTENTTEIEVSDKEYLINIGKQLSLGMDIDEVFFRLGKPDYGMGSATLQFGYFRGDCTLNVKGSVVWWVSVYDNKTKEETVIYSAKAPNAEDTANSDESEYVINLGKQIESGMTEQEVIDKLGEPDENVGSELHWLKYYYENCTLYITVWKARDEVYSVRVYNRETDENTNIYISDEPIIADDDIASSRSINYN